MRSNVQHTLGLTLGLMIGCSAGRVMAAAPTNAPMASTNYVAMAAENLTAARKFFATETNSSTAAWQLGRACFAWGKLLKDPKAQEKIYEEGVAACRHSLKLDPKTGPAYYYFGMNIGRVADLKRNLAAFSMVKDVEKAFQQARVLDESYSYGGPDRNLGLLYHHAPGWPLSLGDEKLARKHLERAVVLAPDYPENRLNLAEAYLEWKERKLFAQELLALEKIWPGAKTNLTGIKWETDWLDWESRRTRLTNAANAK